MGSGEGQADNQDLGSMILSRPAPSGPNIRMGGSHKSMRAADTRIAGGSEKFSSKHFDRNPTIP